MIKVMIFVINAHIFFKVVLFVYFRVKDKDDKGYAFYYKRTSFFNKVVLIVYGNWAINSTSGSSNLSLKALRSLSNGCLTNINVVPSYQKYNNIQYINRSTCLFFPFFRVCGRVKKWRKIMKIIGKRSIFCSRTTKKDLLQQQQKQIIFKCTFFYIFEILA